MGQGGAVMKPSTPHIRISPNLEYIAVDSSGEYRMDSCSLPSAIREATMRLCRPVSREFYVAADGRVRSIQWWR